MMSWLRREVICPWFEARHGKRYRPELAGLRRELAEIADPDARHRLQTARTRAILDHAYHHSAFYRRHYDAAGFHPDQFRHLDDLARVPVFEKAHIIGSQDAIRSDDVPAADLIATATGGTTGNSFRFWYDPACYARREALVVLANEAYGWRPGDPVALVWNAHQDLPTGRPRFRARVRNWLSWRRLIIDATRIDEARLAAWTAEMRRLGTEIVYGYALSIREIAAYLEATGATLPAVRLVVTTAEPLYAADRALIAKAFGCPVRDRYGSRENGPMAQEDEQGRLRYFANSMLLEIEAAPGEAGDVLVTDFWNRAFPFIRYRIGDTAVLAPDGASVAGLPVMGALAGRQTDFLVAQDGSRVSGMTFHEVYVDTRTHAFGTDNFLQIQFRQRAADAILVRIVPGPTFAGAADEANLVALVRRLLGAGMRVDFEYPDAIERTASGKYRFTVNDWETPSAT